jgi:hypothetical protein
VTRANTAGYKGLNSEEFAVQGVEARNAMQEVLELALEWRRMQRFAGHNELNAKLAALGQAVDRYERTR